MRSTKIPSRWFSQISRAQAPYLAQDGVVQVEGVAGILIIQDDQVDRDMPVVPVDEGLQGFGQQGNFTVRGCAPVEWDNRRRCRTSTNWIVPARFAPGYAARRATSPPGKAVRIKAARWLPAAWQSIPARAAPPRCEPGHRQKHGGWLARIGNATTFPMLRGRVGAASVRKVTLVFRMWLQFNFLPQAT